MLCCWIDIDKGLFHANLLLEKEIFWLPYAFTNIRIPFYSALIEWIKKFESDNPKDINLAVISDYPYIEKLRSRGMTISTSCYRHNIVIQFLDNGSAVQQVRAAITFRNPGEISAGFIMHTDKAYIEISLNNLNVYLNGFRVTQSKTVVGDLIINIIHRDYMVIIESWFVAVIIQKHKTNVIIKPENHISSKSGFTFKNIYLDANNNVKNHHLIKTWFVRN